MAIMLSIVRTDAEQVCHADTLVAAVLLDDEGRLAPYSLPCRAGHDARLRPTFEPEEGSPIATIVATAGAERDALLGASLDVLTGAFTTELV